MKHLVMIVALSLAGTFTVAEAADSTCDARAAEKHLAGAAKTSFLKKCEKDAAAAAAAPSAADVCAKKAAEKKLAGAAKTSFTKKCEKDSAQAGAEPPAKK